MFLHVFRGRGYRDWTGASLAVARTTGKGEWLARQLREWTHDFIQSEKKLPTHLYGKFKSSILEHEDLAQEIHLHLQGKGKYICAAHIVQYLETPEMRERLNLKKPISERTAQRWIHNMGYRWKKEPKGQYKDGHERQDVVDYRQNVFLPRWLKLEARTRIWNTDGSEADESATRETRRARWIVIWHHDESIFYANDRRHLRWVNNDESAKPYVKGEGASVMFADFVSPDYGWLRSEDGMEEARVTWKPGKNRDGYFTTADVLEQATKAMDILNKHYPDEEHIFVYDNATTHLTRRPDALSACKMPMNPPKKNFLCEIKNGNTSTFVPMQDGQFPDGTPQSFYDKDGWFKGVQTIIKERIDKGAKIPDPRNRRILAQCKNFKCPPGRKDCCCRRILYSEPDFVSQSLPKHGCKARTTYPYV
ncbi:hypothetical protein NEOLEDRAFT_1076194 [Neolentinus lepideus HHB14362 ss-1]|uniref:Uncharacterized protein n=1 Tax=Neolentinus lepideus HHB14362 ss-1 TaxID=1314782 RepID=A0A165NUJ3_9AGAM|nr:hypothetical protein NEOLEDRAFT_1076194 [Neolentinus lepideus HHB14362 ss-1]